MSSLTHARSRASAPVASLRTGAWFMIRTRTPCPLCSPVSLWLSGWGFSPWRSAAAQVPGPEPRPTQPGGQNSWNASPELPWQQLASLPAASPSSSSGGLTLASFHGPTSWGVPHPQVAVFPPGVCAVLHAGVTISRHWLSFMSVAAYRSNQTGNF